MNFVWTGLILSVALAGTSASAADPSPPPAASPPAAATAQPTISVTSVNPGTRTDPQTVTGTVVEIDLVSPELRTSLSGQSTRLTIDIDCSGEKVRAKDMLVFGGPRQSGASRSVNIKTDWESYKGGAYLADVARSVCAQNVSPTLLMAAGVAPPANAAKPDATATRLSRSPEPGSRRASDATGSALVQFVSSPSEAEVKAQIARIRDRLAAEIGDRQFSIEQAKVKGVTRFRGRLGQFGSKVEAEAFCSKLIELNLPCLPISAPRGN